MNIFKIALIFILTGGLHSAIGQELFNPFSSQAFRFTSELPKNIRSGKAIAIVEVDGVNLYADNALYLSVGDLCQSYFHKSSIDVVAYYLPDDLYSSNQFQRNLSKDFDKREIENIVYIKTNRDFSEASIIITDYVDGRLYVSEGQAAYKLDGQPLEALLDILYKASFKLAKQNFLVNEVAEKGELENAINARRNASFQTSAGRFNLAVSKFEIIDVVKWEKKLGTSQAWPQIKANIESFNAQNAKNNVLLDSILSDYPFKYKLVDPSMTKSAMRKENLLYALFWCRSSGATLQKLFKYKQSSEEQLKTVQSSNGQIVEIKMDPSQVVYKFYMYYVSDSKSTDYYLGPKWDAGVTWEIALRNHLDHFMTYFK